MQQVLDTLSTLEKELADALNYLKLPDLESRMAELETTMNQPGFWDNPHRAQTASREHGHLKNTIEAWRQFESDLKYAQELAGVLNEVEDSEEFEQLKKSVEELAERYEKMEIQLYLGAKYDNYPAILSFYAGAGGTDAQDFAEMLLRMYTRYAEAKEWKVTLLDRSDGEEAGIKSASLRVEGEYAYGLLKEEGGVHRLVRLSPFNAGSTRETSFCKVEVMPEIEFEEVEIDEEDLRIDVFRAGGHGGQGVNTTDSAVRITHLPTGITTQCQNERSQLQNKQQAMKALMSKLVALQEKLQLAELRQIKGEHVETAWGNQIRSYVLHPYQMVKDHRTNYETNQVDKVLEGDPNELDLFIEKSLKSDKK